MFFFLSKIIWFLLAPVNLMAIFLVATAAALYLKRERAARIMLGCALTILLLCGLLPIGPNTLHYLETRYSTPKQLPHDLDGILVLGGAADTNASGIRDHPEFNDSVDRVLAAMELAPQYPQAKIVFSGGSGLLIPDTRTEVGDMKKFFKTIGFQHSHLIYEENSRTTYENIRNSYSLLHPQPGEKWLLITSSYHMPRAMGVAEKTGWTVIPYPVDYRGPDRYRVIPQKFDVLDNLYQSHLTVRELLGMAAYKMAGKSN